MIKRRGLITRYCTLTLAGFLVFGSALSLAQEEKGRKASAGGRKHAPKSLTGEQKVSHLLDRISFGPRPGDLERVMKMGWEKYLDEQLHPERINNDLVESKLKNLESIHLSNSELAKYFPPPQAVREALRSRGLDLPGLGVNPNQAPGQGQKPVEPGKAGEMEDPAARGRQETAPSSSADQIRQRREALKALAEMGFKPPQQVVQELQQAKLLRAVYSEKQLEEVMTDFWFNHFNVFIQKGADRILTTSYERDVIRPHVFGKFEQLLLATAESPAMLFYLDNWMSASPNLTERPFRRDPQGFGRFGGINLPNRGRMPVDRPIDRNNRQNTQQPQPPNNPGLERRNRGLNENYAREIMELHTLGVDGGYTQKDVQEVARCLTGWTLRNPRAGAQFYFNPFMHDDGEKLVLGHKIPAGGGKKDGELVIHILATHPSTAKFISTKLARKFVADNPPQSLIERMVKSYQKSDGDIREVLRTMFNSPEFWSPENYRAKIKTPFEMTVSAVRALGAETNGGPAFHRWIAQMGEGLFLAQPPTGYPDVAEHWVNSGALLERMNFALALGSNRIPGTRVNLDNLAPGIDNTNPRQVVDRYLSLLLRGDVSPQTRATIDKTLDEQMLAKASNLDVAKVVGLILGSPEFQRQ